MAVTEKPELAPVWAESGDTVRPTDAEISEGWPLSATPPSRQRFNWILGWLAQNTAYLRQTGIPPWDAEESYPVDAVVIHNHGLWVAKRENTNVAPGTSPDDWAGAAELLAGSGGLVQKIVAGTGVDISPPEGTGEVTISVTGDLVQKIVAGTGVDISPPEGTGEVTISVTGGSGVQKIVAGTGVDISPPEGTGEVTISVTGGSGVQKIVAGTGVDISPPEGTGEVTISVTGDLVQKIVAGTGVDISPPEGTGEVTISVTGGSGVQKIVAGTGVDISPPEGTGEVTISATGGGGGGGVIPPSPGDHSLDVGFWRIVIGTWTTITGYMDAVTMPKPLGAVLAIDVTEYNAVGWGPPGPNGEVTGPITTYGTTEHADSDKFYVSGAKQAPGDVWKYSGGLGIQYIAIGENPDYVPPTPAP